MTYVPMTSLFALQITSGAEQHIAPYRSIRDCMEDAALAHMLDDTDATCLVYAGKLRLTGTPIADSRGLHEALVDNAKTILRRLL